MLLHETDRPTHRALQRAPAVEFRSGQGRTRKHCRSVSRLPRSALRAPGRSPLSRSSADDQLSAPRAESDLERTAERRRLPSSSSISSSFPSSATSPVSSPPPFPRFSLLRVRAWARLQ